MIQSTSILSMATNLTQIETHQNTCVEKGLFSSQRNRNWPLLLEESFSIKQVKTNPGTRAITLLYSKIERTVNSYFHRISSD